MNNLHTAYFGGTPMLIESYKAKAHLDRVAQFDPATIQANSGLEETLELIFGPRPKMAKNQGLAVIPVKGVIGSGISEIDKMTGSCDVEDIQEMLEDAERDDNIKVIIFDVDSPGGTVTGVPELAKRIRKCKKRTIGWTCKQACSGGYWLLSQCDEVWVSGSSIVCNIGCFMGFLNEAKAYEMEGYKVELFKSGWAKAAGYPGTETTPEQKALFLADVKETHDWFIQDVMSVRSMAKVEDMQGQCWSGRLAASKMLVTGIKDTFDDLLMYVGEDIYEAYEGAEPSVGGTNTYAQSISAEVTPEQGKDEDGTTPISGDKKKKKKKKENGEDDEDEEEQPNSEPEKEIPDDPGCKPVITDEKTKG